MLNVVKIVGRVGINVGRARWGEFGINYGAGWLGRVGFGRIDCQLLVTACMASPSLLFLLLAVSLTPPALLLSWERPPLPQQHYFLCCSQPPCSLQCCCSCI